MLKRFVILFLVASGLAFAFSPVANPAPAYDLVACPAHTAGAGCVTYNKPNVYGVVETYLYYNDVSQYQWIGISFDLQVGTGGSFQGRWECDDFVGQTAAWTAGTYALRDWGRSLVDTGGVRTAHRCAFHIYPSQVPGYANAGTFSAVNVVVQVVPNDVGTVPGAAGASASASASACASAAASAAPSPPPSGCPQPSAPTCAFTSTFFCIPAGTYSCPNAYAGGGGGCVVYMGQSSSVIPTNMLTTGFLVHSELNPPTGGTANFWYLHLLCSAPGDSTSYSYGAAIPGDHGTLATLEHNGGYYAATADPGNGRLSWVTDPYSLTGVSQTQGGASDCITGGRVLRGWVEINGSMANYSFTLPTDWYVQLGIPGGGVAPSQPPSSTPSPSPSQSPGASPNFSAPPGYSPPPLPPVQLPPDSGGGACTPGTLGCLPLGESDVTPPQGVPPNDPNGNGLAACASNDPATKVGYVPYESFAPIHADNQLDLLIKSVGIVPVVLGNTAKWTWNTADNAFVPGGCLGTIVSDATTAWQSHAPFSIISAGAAALNDGMAAAPADLPNIVLPGGVDVPLPLEEVAGAVAPWRGALGALVWVLGILALIRIVAGSFGVGKGGDGG